jgi:hypothetical protein
MRNLINARASEDDLRLEARASGMIGMWADGIRKVLKGTVAFEELLRVAEPDPVAVRQDHAEFTTAVPQVSKAAASAVGHA